MRRLLLLLLLLPLLVVVVVTLQRCSVNDKTGVHGWLWDMSVVLFTTCLLTYLLNYLLTSNTWRTRIWWALDPEQSFTLQPMATEKSFFLQTNEPTFCYTVSLPMFLPQFQRCRRLSESGRRHQRSHRPVPGHRRRGKLEWGFPSGLFLYSAVPPICCTPVRATWSSFRVRAGGGSSVYRRSPRRRRRSRGSHGGSRARAWAASFSQDSCAAPCTGFATDPQWRSMPAHKYV